MVAIGSKFTSTHALYRDSDGGVYFERLPPLTTATEMLTQRALFAPSRGAVIRDRAYWVIGLAMLAGMVSIPWWWGHA